VVTFIFYHRWQMIDEVNATFWLYVINLRIGHTVPSYLIGMSNTPSGMYPILELLNSSSLPMDTRISYVLEVWGHNRGGNA